MAIRSYTLEDGPHLAIERSRDSHQSLRNVDSDVTQEPVRDFDSGNETARLADFVQEACVIVRRVRRWSVPPYTDASITDISYSKPVEQPQDELKQSNSPQALPKLLQASPDVDRRHVLLSSDFADTVSRTTDFRKARFAEALCTIIPRSGHNRKVHFSAKIELIPRASHHRKVHFSAERELIPRASHNRKTRFSDEVEIIPRASHHKRAHFSDEVEVITRASHYKRARFSDEIEIVQRASHYRRARFSDKVEIIPQASYHMTFLVCLDLRPRRASEAESISERNIPEIQDVKERRIIPLRKGTFVGSACSEKSPKNKELDLENDSSSTASNTVAVEQGPSETDLVTPEEKNFQRETIQPAAPLAEIKLESCSKSWSDIYDEDKEEEKQEKAHTASTNKNPVKVSIPPAPIEVDEVESDLDALTKSNTNANCHPLLKTVVENIKNKREAKGSPINCTDGSVYKAYVRRRLDELSGQEAFEAHKDRRQPIEEIEKQNKSRKDIKGRKSVALNLVPTIKIIPAREVAVSEYDHDALKEQFRANRAAAKRNNEGPSGLVQHPPPKQKISWTPDHEAAKKTFLADEEAKRNDGGPLELVRLPSIGENAICKNDLARTSRRPSREGRGTFWVEGPPVLVKFDFDPAESKTKPDPPFRMPVSDK